MRPQVRSRIKYMLGFVVLGVVIWGFMQALRQMNILNPLFHVSFSREVRASQDELLRLTLTFDDKYRLYRPLDEIPEKMQKAVILLEDQWFYTHPGVNPISFFRALASLGSARPVGASTITMQLVRIQKNIYSKNLKGKLEQIFWAMIYEVLYSKKQILEAYLNLTPYGANIEGIGAASQIYFNKDPKDLDLAEILTLAVIPQNPIQRGLSQQLSPKALAAKNKLVERWLLEFPQDKNVSYELTLPLLSKKIKQIPFLAPHFVNQLLKKNPQTLKIKSTLDLKIQNHFEFVLQKYLAAKAIYGIKNGMALLVENKTGKIKAWLGSGDFFAEDISGQIDAVTTKRSPGSTLKPFLYALALDEGLIHSETLLKDTPSYFGPYDPENFDRTYKGPLSATEALIQSRNIPAIWLASRLKKKTLYQFLKDAQVDLSQTEKFYGLAIALGNAEVTPEQLARLYVMLARHGDLIPLVGSEDQQMQSPKDKKYFFEKNTSASQKIISAESAYITLKMLSENPRSENLLMDQSLKNQWPVAWKTGTSFGYRDAWTAGVVGPYTLVVWLGNFDYTSNSQLVGREMASPLFFQLIETLPPQELQKPALWANSFGLNLKKIQVCSVSGDLPNEFCRHLKGTNFIPGVSPITQCHLHREVLISKKSGLRLCHPEGYDFIREVFEFWPSDILEHFSRIHLQRKTPPPFEKGCSGLERQTEDAGLGPQIVSPKTEVDYVISFQRSGNKDQFPLKAIADSSVRRLTWFVNQNLIGQSAPDQTLMALLGPGSYDVMVVDDQGRTAHREMNIKVVK